MRWKCQLKYRLCEKDAGAEEAWRPALLGVEIVVGSGEPSATPILAVDTPRGAFAMLPISRALDPMRRISQGFAPILPVGRFHAKSNSAESSNRAESKSVEAGAETSFDTMIDVDEPPSPPRDGAAPATRESSAARRQRLRAAPVVE